MDPLRNYIKQYKGKFPVSVIWGSGVSVNSLTPNAHVPFLNFAVNSSIMMFPFWKSGSPNNRVFMAIDTDVMNWSWFNDGLKLKCCNLFRRYAYDRGLRNRPYFSDDIYKKKNTYHFDMRKRRDVIFDIDEVNTVPYSSIIPMAIDISLKLGVKLIALAGVEHEARGNLTHFWQEWHPQKRPVQADKEIREPKDKRSQQRVWRKNHYVFKKLAREAPKCGSRIIRLTEKSTLSFIPYMSEANFLKHAKKIR